MLKWCVKVSRSMKNGFRIYYFRCSRIYIGYSFFHTFLHPQKKWKDNKNEWITKILFVNFVMMVDYHYRPLLWANTWYFKTTKVAKLTIYHNINWICHERPLVINKSEIYLANTSQFRRMSNMSCSCCSSVRSDCERSISNSLADSGDVLVFDDSALSLRPC